MQTNIHPDLIGRQGIDEAEKILRNCVHCGFCTATCPTYQLTGDELDGPRGRIYLINNLLADNTIDDASAGHLDRCLTCRSCETTCPSGVEYGRLLDIGRALKTEHSQPPLRARILTAVMRWLVPKPALFGSMLTLGQWLRPVLPIFLKKLIFPSPKKVPAAPELAGQANADPVLLLKGCAQQAATPGVTEALAHLLAQQGRSVRYLEQEGCCGALDHHVAASDAAIRKMEQLISRITESGAGAVVSTASGCGVTIKDYPRILGHRPTVAGAQRVADITVDATELLAGVPFKCQPLKVAVHTPCSLQHGQGINGAIEAILQAAGATLVAAKDSHLCCGSAGTYSILQPALSDQLRNNKLAALQQDKPDVIVTANIGCQMHLGAAATVPVMHWVEFLYHHGAS